MKTAMFAAFTGAAFSLSAWAAATPAPATAPQPAKPAAAAPVKPAAAAKPNAAAPRTEELWFLAKAADGAIGYDAKSIKVNPALSTVSIISLVYLKRGAATKGGKAYSYILSEDTVDCIGSQVQPKSRLVFDAAGQLVDAGDALPNTGWGAIPPNSPLGAFRSVACTAATFSDAKQAPNLTAAMKAMKEMK